MTFPARLPKAVATHWFVGIPILVAAVVAGGAALFLLVYVPHQRAALLDSVAGALSARADLRLMAVERWIADNYEDAAAVAAAIADGAPRAEFHLHRGYRASGAFPVLTQVAVRTVLNVYAAEAGVFDAETVSLLEEVAGDLGFALTGLEDAAARSRAEADVRRLNVELEERVTQRTAQIEAANQELEAFAYSVSHDLRAPLRAIDGFGRMLEEDHTLRLDDEGRRLLAVVRSSTMRMG